MIDKGKNPTSVYIGNQIRKGRMLRGLTQKELSQKIKEPITFQQLQKYEQAINRISVELLLKIAKILDLPISYFVPEQKSEPIPEIKEDEFELLKQFKKLDKEGREALLCFLHRVR